jgi:hypothetical protein
MAIEFAKVRNATRCHFGLQRIMQTAIFVAIRKTREGRIGGTCVFFPSVGPYFVAWWRVSQNTSGIAFNFFFFSRSVEFAISMKPVTLLGSTKVTRR